MKTKDEPEIRAIIREFILSTIQLPELTDDDNLFESGIVNSLFAVELMTFLEKCFAIEIAPEDLDMANFQSIANAAAFVIRKSPLATAI